MISVQDALGRIAEHVSAKSARAVALAEALDLVLAEDIASDIDSPPHDKALMDGYAVVAADLQDAPRDLDVIEVVTAGETPSRPVSSGQATRIMTGAPIPSGADAVVMVELTRTDDEAGQRVHIDGPAASVGQNILPRGASLRRDEVVLKAGVPLRPIEIGLLAEVGRATVRATPRPTVAVLSTGNELVPADQLPDAGQIRNSNGPMLAAQVYRAGGLPVELGIGRDDRDALRRLMARGLEEDVLVLSGGVSAGILDLVPSVLGELGVEQVFHKVNLKPGKPVWFGRRAADATADQRHTLVFGLPGNPVSSLVCFELFVRPALKGLAGLAPSGPPRRIARLECRHHQRSDRPTYFPARLADEAGRLIVRPLPWKGSADLRTLADANCLAYFPPGERIFEADDQVDVFDF